MFCNNCGNYLEDNTLFCPNCGNPVGDNAVIDGQNYSANINPNVYNQGANMGYQQPMYNQPPVMPQQPMYTPPIQPIAPTVINVQQTVQKTKSANGYCVASFVLSMCCFFIVPLICGAAAVILGIVGLVTYDENKHTSKWMAIVGIIVGAIGFLIGLIAVSFVAALFDSLASYY